MKPSTLIITLSALFFSAFSQQKVFQISDDGKYLFLDKEYLNQPVVTNADLLSLYNPITMRTFYLEAKRMGVFPMSINYPQFTAMTITEQQNLLNNLQGEVKRANYEIENTQAATPEVDVREKSEKRHESEESYFDEIAIRQVGYDKTNQIIVGELVSASGVLQQFLLYPVGKVKNGKSNNNWVIEMLEPELIQKRKGYGNLTIDFNTFYRLLAQEGINDQFLQSLLASN